MLVYAVYVVEAGETALDLPVAHRVDAEVRVLLLRLRLYAAQVLPHRVVAALQSEHQTLVGMDWISGPCPEPDADLA